MIDFYQDLLIKQYWEQPNALAEIGLKAGQSYAIKEFIDLIASSLDLDNAVDDRLDKIGKLVGIGRTVEFSAPKNYFGFSNNPNAKGFNQAPFASKFTPNYTDTQLDNYTYRQFIKAKIALNVMHGSMIADDDKICLQDVIKSVFGGVAYVIDNQDMTLSLYVPYNFDESKLRLVAQAGLLPTTQAVKYRAFIKAQAGSFGFSKNVNSSGFSSKFNTNYNGGKFARKIIL